MTSVEKQLKKLTLATIGGMAKQAERMEKFFDEISEDDHFEALIKKGKEIVEEGKEANKELRHKAEEEFDKILDRKKDYEKKEPDYESMTKEERAELIKKLQAMDKK